MEMPTDDTPPPAYLPRSAYTMSRVAADPKTKGLEAGLATAHTNLKQALRDEEDKNEEEQKKRAILEVKDEKADESVESLELVPLVSGPSNLVELLTSGTGL